MDRAALVKTARTHLCELQRETADALGYELSSYERKENGRARVRDVDLLAIAARCNGINTVEDAKRVIETAANRRRK